jgi:DNA polymerase
VKHFKWEPRGKRRIHQKPKASEIRACQPWLEAEIDALRPELIVCLGATAAQALLGPSFRLTHHRGERLALATAPAAVLATIHPSAVLRAPAGARREAMDGLVADLRRAAEVLASFEDVERRAP